jgi:hypothetical protein
VSRRERWFGATGLKVPEIALAGEVDLDGALVLDTIDDLAAIEAAHANGVPVVVRAGTVGEIRTALARPEVACVLVEDVALLSVDLADLTYG